MDHFLASLDEVDKCIPWYLPPVDPNARLCSPSEAWNFSKEMDKYLSVSGDGLTSKYKVLLLDHNYGMGLIQNNVE